MARLRKIVDCIKDTPCYDCGGIFSPQKLTFDHLPEYEKKANINDIIKKKSLRQLLIEIAKCDVVCRPCHDAREIKRVRPM